jgi:signal transduction histidine kinase
MRKFNSKIFTVIILLLVLTPQKVLAQNKVKNILILFSLSSNLPSYQNLLEGLKSILSEGNGEPVNLIIEYLDMGRSENEEYDRHIIEMYNKKLKGVKIDLLIAVGPGVNALLLKYEQDELKSVPVLDLDLDMPGRTSLRDLGVKNGLEIVVKLDIRNTLKEAFDLFPEYKNVFVISGVSNSDIYFTSLVSKNINEFGPSYNFNFISGLSMDSTLSFVKNIHENSIVIVPLFLQDSRNVPFSTPEALTFISANSRAPVFTLTDAFGKKQGGIGGFVLSYRNVGKEAGRIAREMLKGTQPKNISVNEVSFYQHIFDWQELKRWNLLDSKAIPADSIFYNQDISFFTKYEWYILGLLIFLVSQTMLILYLYKLNRRQKEITEKMLETENMHRELIREDRLAKMTELTASLSHELNQPLTAILYSAQAGKRFIQSGKLDQRQAQEIFDNIIEDDKRAGSIISSVKSLMKLENRDKENVNLNILIQETIDIVKTEAIRHGIKISLNCNPRHEIVNADKIQLQQVLMNFIRNAMIAMERNDPENKKLQIALTSEKSSAIVSVSDSGPGIDDSIKERLFMPFVTTTKKGFGIGLALSRSIIEKHNGEIWAENLPSGGARFSFRLHIIKNE